MVLEAGKSKPKMLVDLVSDEALPSCNLREKDLFWLTGLEGYRQPQWRRHGSRQGRHCGRSRRLGGHIVLTVQM